MAYLIALGRHLIMLRLLTFVFAVFLTGAFFLSPRAYADISERSVDKLIEQIVAAETAPTDTSTVHIDPKDAHGSYEKCKERWQSSGGPIPGTDSVSLETLQRIRFDEDFLECMMQIIDVQAGKIFNENDKDAFLSAIRYQQFETHVDEYGHDVGFLAREREIKRHIGYVQLFVEVLLTGLSPDSPPAK
jgi:hypothetical protein